MRESALELSVNDAKLVGLPEALGPRGIGSFMLSGVLSQNQLTTVMNEVMEPGNISWRDNHDSFVNMRNMTVVENHMTSALKLHKGDPSYIERVPHLATLADNIQQLVQSLDDIFPSLTQWTADEMSLHRYDDPEIGLSFHRDNLRFIGLIAVLAIEGESDFVIRDEGGDEHVFATFPGDLVLTRATGLYPAFDDNGKPINLCPDHAVMNLRTPFRTSFIVRANNRPDEQIPGFSYANWKPAPEMIR
jgi:hypothetical protein